MHFLLHGKSYLLFSDFLKRWSFQKNCARIWSYCIIGADDISFSWKYDLTPWTENERWSPSKKKQKQKQNKKNETMTLSSNVLKRWSFQKNRAGIWSFLYYLERWYFFRKMIFRKKYMETWYFLYIRVNVTNTVLRPLSSPNPSQKKSRMIFSCKNTLKGDWGSR